MMLRFFSLSMALWLSTAIAVFGQLPPGFAREQIATGLDPTTMALAPDGRIFILEKSGRVRIVRDGELLPDPFLTIAVDNYNERGLSGIAFHPDFEQTHYLYLFYTVPGGNHNRVSRFTANGDYAVPGSEEVLLDLDPMPGTIHNAGGMAFGADGKLYVATGEGAFPPASQDLGSLLGKVLRLNPDGSVPSDNPFYGLADGDFRSIYALGFRNPFTFVQRPNSNTFFVGDVGSEHWEEINEVVAGGNYGWPAVEGRRTDEVPPPGYRDPLYAYDHDAGCAVAGGAFYEPEVPVFPPEYHGRFFFGDYCEGEIRVLDPVAGLVEGVFATGVERPISMLVTPEGDLYYLARAGIGGGSEQDNTSTDEGSLWRVHYTGSGAPSVSVQPQSITVPVGEDAVFIILATGSAPVGYQWQKDGVDLPGADEPTLRYPAVTLADDGSRFRCRISNGEGAVFTQEALLTVTANSRPIPVINAPSEGATYAAGDTIFFSGSATDNEDGALTPFDLRWRIDFHHDNHSHPGLETVEGISEGTFAIPRVGELYDNVWYRVLLTAVDQEGLTQTVYRDVLPEKTQFTVRSEPPGLTVNVDGQQVATPHTVTSVRGVRRTLSAESARREGDQIYVFSEWMNGSTDELFTFLAGELDEITVRYEEKPLFIGTGSGLLGEYFAATADAPFESPPVLTRIDPVIDFNWDQGSPDDGRLEADFFTVRWQGQVMPPLSGDYTFRLFSDDGLRLWFDDELVIDQWVPQAVTEMTFDVSLEGGRRYPLRIEYFEEGGHAVAHMLWESDLLPREVVPSTQLFPLELPAEEDGYEVAIFPNPAFDRLTVKVVNHRREIVTLRIYDLLGRLLQSRTVESERGAYTFDLDLSALQAGAYILAADGLLQIDEKIMFVKN